jgi:hypothetical protein
MAAQSELQSALTRLDAEPMQELGDGTDDLVIAEAEQRVLEAGTAELPPPPPINDDDVIEIDVEPQPVGSMAGGVGTASVNDDTPPDLDQVLSEPAIEPQDEDALSRLVREAMQRAVESAKGSERN